MNGEALKSSKQEPGDDNDWPPPSPAVCIAKLYPIQSGFHLPVIDEFGSEFGLLCKG